MMDVRNCILWGNNGGGSQLAGLEVDEVYYSCFPDCNDVNSQHNINENPGFAYSYPEYGYYHLASDSNCIDAGDPNFSYADQVDIDGDDRIFADYVVDIGADEFSCGDVSSSADLNADGIVNLIDFAVIADSWLSSDPNEPGITTDPNFIGEPHYRDPAALVAWNDLCNFDADYYIDLNDLAYFVYDGYWLWTACWRTDVLEQMAMAGAGVSETTQPTQTIKEQYQHALQVTVWLEQLWFEDTEIKNTIDEKDWKEFMEAVYDWLGEVEETYNSKDN